MIITTITTTTRILLFYWFDIWINSCNNYNNNNNHLNKLELVASIITAAIVLVIQLVLNSHDSWQLKRFVNWLMENKHSLPLILPQGYGNLWTYLLSKF